MSKTRNAERELISETIDLNIIGVVMTEGLKTKITPKLHTWTHKFRSDGCF